MADYTYDQLKDMKIDQLREIAAGVQHEAIQGYTVMHKEHLLPALCKALGVEQPHLVAHGEAKTKIKQTIRKLKAQRREALAAKDRGKYAAVRHQIHALKRRLRRMATRGA